MNLDLFEMQEELKKINEKPFRAKQIIGWLYKGASFDEMRNLSKGLIEKLKQHYLAGCAEIISTVESSDGSTYKNLHRLHDGNIIESVLMRYSYGNTMCISTQVGCAMDCSFCASTVGGLVRNLTAGEMAACVAAVNKREEPLREGRGVSRLVLMGIGEPLNNYDNVMKFLRLIHSNDGMNFSYRNITLSTCGLVPEIDRLAREGLPITLSISLHAADDKVRNSIVKVNNRWGIDRLIKAAKDYYKITGRRPTFEYVLIKDVNDSMELAVMLADKIKGLGFHVNLIPLNEVYDIGLYRSSQNAVNKFKTILENRGIDVTLRREMGTDIEGACGQLRRSTMDED